MRGFVTELYPATKGPRALAAMIQGLHAMGEEGSEAKLTNPPEPQAAFTPPSMPILYIPSP